MRAPRPLAKLFRIAMAMMILAGSVELGRPSTVASASSPNPVQVEASDQSKLAEFPRATRLLERNDLAALIEKGSTDVLTTPQAEDNLYKPALPLPMPTQAVPTPSGATSPVPLNNLFDAQPVDYTNLVPNLDFEQVAYTTGTPPTNYDFETGDLSNWASSGTVSVLSGGPTGYYAQLGAAGRLTTTAFTVPNDAQTMTFSAKTDAFSAFYWDTARDLPMVISDTNDIYLHGLGLISRQYSQSGAVEYYHPDGLGTLRNLTNSSGQVIVGSSYDAFGALRTGNTTSDFLFAGEQFDAETGLYYLRARYYDPSTGRFITRDPFHGLLANPSSLNPYTYVENNPVNLVGPSGRIAWAHPAESRGFLSCWERGRSTRLARRFWMRIPRQAPCWTLALASKTRPLPLVFLYWARRHPVVDTPLLVNRLSVSMGRDGSQKI